MIARRHSAQSGQGIDSARTALADERYETARRLALAHVPSDPADAEQRGLVLHDALAKLGDLHGALAALAGHGGSFETALRQLDDLFRSSASSFYRLSMEQSRGLSYEEFLAARQAARAAAARSTLATITSATQAARARTVLRRIVADAERRVPSDTATLVELDRTWPVPASAAATAATEVDVLVRGRIHFLDGRVPCATVTLGVEQPVPAADPMTVDPHAITIALPAEGALAALSAPLAADGSFTITGRTAAGRGFIALTSTAAEGLPTSFLARDLTIDGSVLPPLALHCTPWRSAPSVEAPPPLPAHLDLDGVRWHKQDETALSNPFWHDFPRQDLRLAWAEPGAGMRALVWDGSAVLPHQIDRVGAVLCFTSLARRSTCQLGWYHAAAVPDSQETSLLTVETGGTTAVLATSRSTFRIPWGSAADGAAPVLATMGPDSVWRGAGRWRLADQAVPQRTTAVLTDGPLECVVEITYRFADGACCSFTLTAHAGEEYLLVEERGEALPGVEFVFGLEEFRGGRGYLHWCAEGEAPHWHDLLDVDRELARLQESVPWWIPPAGFAWAATHDGLERRDLIGVFTRRRGDWLDHDFAAIAGGPPAGGHELDWPYPEMVGSTISMITVASTADGRLEMRFPRFAGTRHWGLLASDTARGDGRLKELQQVRHKTSFPRLDQLRHWQLDRADDGARPCLIAERDRLPAIRAKLSEPAFAALWQRLQGESRYHDNEALRFAITGDPLTGWRVARRLAALVPAQARCLLLSRENGDVWSPVGGRVWAPQALAFDALVGSGALSIGEEREVRAGLLLAGHMFMSPELMNWRYGSRNANFEADRIDAVGTIGLCFPGNPDAEVMVEHVIGRMRVALNSYCTPGSGKWYENPACYYLHGLKCRMAIASHLAARGRLDLAAVPRMGEFLGWMLHMLMPRLPTSYAAMRDGCTHGQYAALQRVRRIAPIGDHAHLGPWVPDMAAVVAKWLADVPELANALRWAWSEGGSDGGYHGNAGQLLVQSEAADLAPAPTAPELPSRRLEGFGAIFRDQVGTEREFMLLAKLGPGGYRYHRSEGSFILIADGRPLVYDGGEAGEAWRHSTITYHEARLPPAAGRIERFAALPALDYAQGIHPVVLAPGDPVFLSDVCEHQLVAEAHRRSRIGHPAAARAWLAVKGDYVVVWDRLDVADDVVHRWNLQVMADSESGDPRTPDGLRFAGRFGTDLQVALPAGGDRPWTVEDVRMKEYHLPEAECVAQRHLEVTSQGAGDWLAVLRPLPPGAQPVTCAPLQAIGRTVGVRVTGDGIDDRLVLGRTTCALSDGVWQFAGSAGACLRRPDGLRLVLLGAGRIAVGDAVLESSGPAAELTISGGAPRLVYDGQGDVAATVAGRAIVGDLVSSPR